MKESFTNKSNSLNFLKESLGSDKYNKIQSLIKECLEEGIQVEITIPKNKCKNLNESLTKSSLLSKLKKNKIYFDQLDGVLKDNPKIKSELKKMIKKFYNSLLDPIMDEYALDKEFSKQFIEKEVTLDKLYLKWSGDSEWLDCYPYFDNNRLNNSEAIEVATESAWNESEGGSGCCFNDMGIYIGNLEFDSLSVEDNAKTIFDEILKNKLYCVFGYSKEEWGNLNK